MTPTLIAVVVEQYNKIAELESQVARLKQAVEAHAISGIGELNEYLMDNEIGVVGDMTAKAALDHIKDLKSRFTTLDEASNELLGDYLVAEERARELEIELNAKPDPPEPEDEVKTVLCSDCGNMIEIASNTTEDTYLSDFRVLKTAICIILYSVKQIRTEWEIESCIRAVSMIKGFTEDVRLWNGLDDLEPYRWGSLGNGEKYLIDKEWKK